MKWNDRKNQAPEKEALCLIHVFYGGEYGYDQYYLGMPCLDDKGFACGDEMSAYRCDEWIPFEGDINLGYKIKVLDKVEWAYIEDINQLLMAK